MSSLCLMTSVPLTCLTAEVAVISSTFFIGTPYSSSPTSTNNTFTMAIVTGRRSATVLPSPGVESTLTDPSSCVTVSWTTSIPTPRPLVSVTSSAVEKPGWKTRS